ncbi:MAG TPA: hypothetical protein VH721_01570 [Gaiellaceae bacterium]|jgi:hypothetical protein
MNVPSIITVVGAALALAAQGGYAATERIPEHAPLAKPPANTQRVNLDVLVNASASHSAKHKRGKHLQRARPLRDVGPGRILIWVSSGPLGEMQGGAIDGSGSQVP